MSTCESDLVALGERLVAEARNLLRDLEAVEPYVTDHGTPDDRDWFAGVRREVWMERRA